MVRLLLCLYPNKRNHIIILMKRNIYEVLKNGESMGRFYNIENHAQIYADRQNRTVIIQTMLKVNKMTGAIRGANRIAFGQCIDDMCNLPYSVERRGLQ